MLLIFSMFTWAYLIIKILCKLGAKNPAIKPHHATPAKKVEAKKEA